MLLDTAWLGLSALDGASSAGHIRRVVEDMRALPGMQRTTLPDGAALRAAANERRELARLHDFDLETGLANLTHFNRVIREAERLSRTRFERLVVVLLSFPKTTDPLRLVKAAHLCAACLRADDLVARLGDRRLGVLLRDIARPGGSAVLERMRAAVSDSGVVRHQSELSVRFVAREYARAPRSAEPPARSLRPADTQCVTRHAHGA
jgi:GGDEF domain-containing protein